MAGAGYKNESYAKLGMGRFTSWFRPPGVPEVKRPADLDGVFHDAKTNRFILFEFKPANRQPDGTLQLSEPTQGQQITLRGFSRLPGCLSILVFDPAWNKQVQKYNDQQPLVVWVWNDGERVEHNITLEQLNGTIAKWYERRELPFESGSPA